MIRADVFPISLPYKFNSSDGFLIDANVWILLNGPPGLKRDIAADYSSALRKMLAVKCRVFVDVLVLSEFVNRYLRYKFDMSNPSQKVTFKDFRSSTDYPAVAKDIANAVRGILKTCRPVNSGLESIDMEALLTDFEQKQRDFNDQVLAELCASKKLALISHDGDFRGFGITVLTANSRMLEPDSEATGGAKTPSA